MTLTVLMVAEKPSIAETIATILCHGSKQFRKSISPVCGIHEYYGTFDGKDAFFKVTSTAGHVFSLDFPGSYNNWEKTPPETLFDAPTQKNEATSKMRIPAHLSKEATDCDHLVLWLDCDREGENICYEVIDCVQNKMRRLLHNQPIQASGPHQQIWRAHFSSLADVDIKRAMHLLNSPNRAEALSVDCRQELDLKIGCAFTRFQTHYFQGKYGNLESRLISYGPCQTPTLFFCVQRTDEITSFQPETFYRVDVEIPVGGQKYWLEWSRGELNCFALLTVFDQTVGKIFKDLVSEKGVANISKVVTKEECRVRPLAMNTVAMLKGASTLLGLGPKRALEASLIMAVSVKYEIHFVVDLKIAEHLYLGQLITYPRTETTMYPKNFCLEEAVAGQKSNDTWGKYASELLTEGLTMPRQGVDCRDHPPITPLKLTSSHHLDGDSLRLYEFIARHFLATVSSDCIFLKTQVVFQIGEEKFNLSGRKVIKPGWTRISRSGALEDQELPDFHEGDIIKPSQVLLNEGKTKPPDYLTESDLLTLMEKHGIGTDASMSTHINNICERNYVELVSNRRLQPTKLGISLVHGYISIDPELVLPSIRASIESQCTLIAQGKAEKDIVLSHCLDLFKQKFEYFVRKIEKMDALFESTFTQLAQSGEPFSRCGQCNRYMKLIRSRPSRLYCNNCSTTYSLPSMGSIKLYQGLKCPLDNFDLVLCVQSGRGKTFPLCPLCYNEPPFEAYQGGKMNCLQCEHPTCPHSVISQGICCCPIDGCQGTLCLDALSRPKWKIDCNSCNFQLQVPEKVHNFLNLVNIKTCYTMFCVRAFFTSDSCIPLHVLELTVLASMNCDHCGSSYVEVIFHKDKIVQTDPQEIKGCIVCNSELNQLFHGKFSKTVYQRRRGVGGRRGKGRGKRKDVDLKMTFDRF